MVLLETGELLLHEDTATVVEVMSRQVFDVLHTLPAHHSCLLALILVLSVHEADETEGHGEPE